MSFASAKVLRESIIGTRQTKSILCCLSSEPLFVLIDWKYSTEINRSSGDNIGSNQRFLLFFSNKCVFMMPPSTLISSKCQGKQQQLARHLVSNVDKHFSSMNHSLSRLSRELIEIRIVWIRQRNLT